MKIEFGESFRRRRAVWCCNFVFIDGLGAISDVGENFNIIIESQ